MTRSLSLTALVLALTAMACLQAAAAPQGPPNRYVLTLSTDTRPLPFKLPPGLPPEALAAMGNLTEPTRLITGEATYTDVPTPPFWVTVPKDLRLPQNKLILELPQPVEAPGVPGETPDVPEVPTGPVDMTIKLYWHPDEAHGPLDQSVHFDPATMQVPEGGEVDARTAEFMGAFEQMEKTATGSHSEFPKTVVGKGDYVLNTGNITAPLGGFLPPIQVSEPAGLSDVDISQPIEVKWAPVKGARGFILHAMAMKRDGNKVSSITNWVSTLHEPPLRVRSGYEQETTIADDLENGLLLPATATSCVVPGGIFPADAEMFTLDVTAVGNDFYSRQDGVTTFGKIRATWTAMKMPGMDAGMGGFGGMEMPDMGDEEEEDTGEE